jgi:integrase
MAREAAKWIPLLALFTGARLEELGRLHVSDVRTEAGVLYLSINVEDHGKHIKTANSLRKVPVHPQLIELGFVEYVAARRRAGDLRLFPDLKSQQEQVTAGFSTWWGRYTEDLGITDKRKVFHSFRHGVKRALRNAGVDQTLFDALQGHANASVSNDYGLDEEGHGYGLPALYGAISKLTYPGLDLSHLYPPGAPATPATMAREAP